MKIRKFFVILLSVIILCLCLTACNENMDDNYTSGSDRLICIEGGKVGASSYQIYYDKETKVMYLFTKTGYGGGLTVMLDENGKPLLYEE